MHECPECGQVCDCDGEDTWYGWDEIEDCNCDCWLEDESENYDDDAC